MSILKIPLKVLFIFSLIILFLLLINCTTSPYSHSYATIKVKIYSQQKPDDLRLILRDNGASGNLTSYESSPNILELPGGKDKYILKMYDYFNERRILDTIEPGEPLNIDYDDNGDPILDGLYLFHIEFLDEETDTLISTYEFYGIIIKEEYNDSIYKETGVLPVFTCIPDDYFYIIDNIPLEPIIFPMQDSWGNDFEYIFESPFMFSCRNTVEQKEICKKITLKSGWKVSVDFDFAGSKLKNSHCPK